MQDYRLCKIGAVYELDGITPNKSRSFRVGRHGWVRPPTIGDGLEMIYIEPDLIAKMLLTSNIVDVHETDYGFWVTTENSVYRFDGCYLRCPAEERTIY